jgi:uncharacterized membrane protein
MHVKVYELLGSSYGRYRNAVGHKIAMTREGLFKAVVGIMTGSIGIFGGLTIPRESHEQRFLRMPAGFEKVKMYFESIQTEHGK